MKKIGLLVSAALFLLTGFVFAQTSRAVNSKQIICKADSVLPQGQGCCSWHGGECGCSPEGRDVCCDGSLSPSCGCHAGRIQSAAPSDLLARYSGSVHVHGYTRKNGTYVAPHVRTAPDSTKYNNWSTRGNINPYTGKAGTKNPY
jgi:hypothetical protein